MTVNWWRHKTHYEVTEAYCALRNILTVHLNNGATRTDLREIPKHCVVTAKAERQSTIHTDDFDAIFFITSYGINTYSYSGFLWARCSPWDIEQRVFDPRASLGSWRPAVGPAAADFPRDVWLTVSRNHKIFLLYVTRKDMCFDVASIPFEFQLYRLRWGWFT